MSLLKTPRRARLGIGIAFALCALVSVGCTGEIRQTTTPRTATEQLLVSAAAERALINFEQLAKRLLDNKRVFIDDSQLDALHKPYIVSSLRNLLARNKAILVDKGPTKLKIDGKEQDVTPDLVCEIRSGAVGIKDTDFGFGIPPLPIPIPQTNLNSVAPGLYLFARDKQEGWARLQIWIYNPANRRYVAQSGDLWGTAYYSSWVFFGLGPFDFSEDIYPEDEG